MTSNEKQNLLVMKFLHYFITEKNYNPVVVHGIQNEIWLENMDSEFRIVRIVMGYIHNKEQLDFDYYKVKKLVKQIKLKTFTFKIKTLSLYIDLNDDVQIPSSKDNYGVNVKNENLLKKNDVIKQYFPDMMKKLKFTEQGALLYEKINRDILKKNIKDSEKINDLFSEKKPYVTNLLIGIITFLMILMTLYGGSTNTSVLYSFGGLIKNGNPIRLISSLFLHIGLVHYITNTWSLYILGRQTENFYGHFKTLIIFIYSGIVGNLLSMLLMGENVISAGASGAIFGLMGALLYFSLNQRTYMGEALKNQILPVIIINLALSFMLPQINLFAHLGGLIGGIIMSIALGIKYKTSKFEKINGFIAALILIGVLSYMVYFA